VTINDLKINISILQKSMKANPSKQEKDEDTGSLRKAKGKKRKATTEDLRHLSLMMTLISPLRFTLLTKSEAF